MREGGFHAERVGKLRALTGENKLILQVASVWSSLLFALWTRIAVCEPVSVNEICGRPIKYAVGF